MTNNTENDGIYSQTFCANIHMHRVYIGCLCTSMIHPGENKKFTRLCRYVKRVKNYCFIKRGILNLKCSQRDIHRYLLPKPPNERKKKQKRKEKVKREKRGWSQKRVGDI